MAKQKPKPPQSASATRQMYLRSRSDTSQTVQANLSSDSTATVGARRPRDEDDYSFDVSAIRGSRGKSTDGWTIASTVGTWAAVAIALIVVVASVVWYVSKMDSGLASVETKVNDVRTKVDKLADDSQKQSNRLENIERSVAGIDQSLSNLALPRRDRQRNP